MNHLHLVTGDEFPEPHMTAGMTTADTDDIGCGDPFGETFAARATDAAAGTIARALAVAALAVAAAVAVAWFLPVAR